MFGETKHTIGVGRTAYWPEQDVFVDPGQALPAQLAEWTHVLWAPRNAQEVGVKHSGFSQTPITHHPLLPGLLGEGQGQFWPHVFV